MTTTTNSRRYQGGKPFYGSENGTEPRKITKGLRRQWKRMAMQSGGTERAKAHVDLQKSYVQR